KLFIFLVILISSCNTSNELKEYYSSGNLKRIDFVNSNNIDSTLIFYDEPYKTIKAKSVSRNGFEYFEEYYKNGKLFRKGKLSNSKQQYEKWYYYNPSGLLSDVREYMVIKGKSVLNQIWYLDRIGDTIKTRSDEFNHYGEEFKDRMTFQKQSHFIKFQIPKDTISMDEPFKAVIFHATPLSTYHNGFIKVYVDNENTPFNDDFSNDKNIDLREFNSLIQDTANQKWYPNDTINYPYISIFGQFFDSVGKKALCGYMSEVINDTLKTGEIKQSSINKIYFKLPVYVTN